MQYYTLLLSLIVLSFVGFKPASEPAVRASEAKNSGKKAPLNIIFMVGDGMGLTQITAGLYSNGNKLSLEKMKHIGFIKTHSADKLITDSAAGATAFSCGVKTYNNAVGVDKDTVAKETIMEAAKKKGMRTGLVVTCTVTHATPSSFYAHQKTRKMHPEIALDILGGDVDWFIGGGKAFFENRADGRNLSDELRGMGYTIGYTLADLKADMDKAGVLAADTELVTMAQGRGDFLLKGSELAIQGLNKGDQGFFLLIEGSQIDWGGHAKSSQYIIDEMIDFDNTIGRVLEFAEKDGNTLVIVTADHETGGYAINGGNLHDKTVEGAFTTGHHTGTMVPVFAFGPGAEEFMGIHENTAIYSKMMALLGLK
jgi:alkaline phosphatase